MSSLPRSLLHLRYEREAQKYLKSLPLEHFMEATPQATQRRITLESLHLVEAERSDFHLFNELLVQYPLPHNRIGKVVPDNMVVLHEGTLQAVGSYNLPFQPAGPFWVMEYVSKESERKDYDESFVKYEQELKVPYYLLFYPDQQEMTLFRRTKTKYVSVPPSKEGRCAIARVDIEVGLLDGWVRYWYRGELLPLPPDLMRSLVEERKRSAELERRLELEEQRSAELARGMEEANQARQAAEEEAKRLREELARQQGKQK